MKSEIVIPPQYEEIIKSISEKQGVSLDDVVENALKNFMERSAADAE